MPAGVWIRIAAVAVNRFGIARRTPSDSRLALTHVAAMAGQRRRSSRTKSSGSNEMALT